MITVFTPVYNRAYIIDQLYQSLLRQTNKEFEWLIIDDGSTDNIAKLAEHWIECTKEFSIKFYQQPNGGKHRAINRGVQLADGEAFLLVDSDDYLVDDAIDTVYKYWNQIRNDSKFAGTAGLRLYSDMRIVGDVPRFTEYVDATNLERQQYGLRGDKAEVYRTELLKRFPFPEFEGENFVTEAVIWNQIAYQGYKIRWFAKGVIICDYLEDGLTAGGDRLFLDNPKGWAEYLKREHIYRSWSDEFYTRQCFNYYEKKRLELDVFQMVELLGIDAERMNEIAEAHCNIQKKLIGLCREKEICIYAYGVWGKRLRQYLTECRLSVSYVIDRRKVDANGLPLYSPYAELPKADVVFVALKKRAEDVIPALRAKVKTAQIVTVTELVGKWW